MNIRDIIRAWRDQEFREELTDEELAKFPDNPAGEILLTEEDMAYVDGGVSVYQNPTHQQICKE